MKEKIEELHNYYVETVHIILNEYREEMKQLLDKKYHLKTELKNKLSTRKVQSNNKPDQDNSFEIFKKIEEKEIKKKVEF